MQFRQSPFPGALVPSSVKAEKTQAADSCPPGVRLRKHAGPEATARDAGERLGARSLVKAQHAYLLSTFPYSEGWVGLAWPILQSRASRTKGQSVSAP